MVGVSGRSSHEKNMVVNTAVKSESCVIWISKNIQKYWMFAVSTFNTMEANKETKHDNHNLQRASWDLASNLKKQLIYTVFTKSASKNSLN